MISKSCDLLELYCGNGNHTVAIAGGAYLIISYHIISYCVISYYVISYHIVSHIILYHIISYHITLDKIKLFDIQSYLIAFARRVVAVEMNKSLCVAAEGNLKVNNIENVLVIPCDSEVFARNILQKKCYTRKDTGEVYDFKAVLVDPPR